MFQLQIDWFLSKEKIRRDVYGNGLKKQKLHRDIKYVVFMAFNIFRAILWFMALCSAVRDYCGLWHSAVR